MSIHSGSALPLTLLLIPEGFTEQRLTCLVPLLSRAVLLPDLCLAELEMSRRRPPLSTVYQHANLPDVGQTGRLI